MMKFLINKPYIIFIILFFSVSGFGVPQSFDPDDLDKTRDFHQKGFKGAMAEILKERKQACDAGNIWACNRLGNSEYTHGNEIEAAKYWAIACNAGYVYGCSSLGDLEYERGNEIEAAKYWKKTCDSREGIYSRPYTCLKLGKWEEGRGNKAEATSLYEKLCDGAYLYGCESLYPGDSERAFREAARSACDIGWMSGCFDLGELEYKLGNNREAAKYLKIACDAGVKAACEDLTLVLVQYEYEYEFSGMESP